MHNLCSDAIRLSMFLAAYQRCRTASAKQSCIEKAKDIKKANRSKTEDQPFLICLCFFLLLCSLFFPPHFLLLFNFLLKTKSNASNNKKSRTKRPTSLFPPTFVSQNFVMAPWKTHSDKISQRLLLFSQSSNTQEPNE